MTALTFEQALKYRSDQARDERGRWTSEGSRRAGSKNPRSQMSQQARRLHDRINELNGRELSDAKIDAYKDALAELKGMRLSRTEALTFARLMGVEFAPKSTTGKWAKERAESEMFDHLRYLRYLRGKGQTP